MAGIRAGGIVGRLPKLCAQWPMTEVRYVSRPLTVARAAQVGLLLKRIHRSASRLTAMCDTHREHQPFQFSAGTLLCCIKTINLLSLLNFNLSAAGDISKHLNGDAYF